MTYANTTSTFTPSELAADQYRNALRDAVHDRFPRVRKSAWQRGVMMYVGMLLDGIETSAPLTEEALLNGARNWREYSWGGSALIYDQDIAHFLCTPYELRRTKNGLRRPNRREEWLDVQARALYQASRLLLEAAARIDMASRSAALSELPMAGE